MKKIGAFLKKHPLAIVLIVVALFVIAFLIIRSQPGSLVAQQSQGTTNAGSTHQNPPPHGHTHRRRQSNTGG